MGMVLAVRDDSDGRYVGFQVDPEILECSECTRTAVIYQLRYTEDEQRNLTQHRLAALRAIENEHPNHSEKIRVG
jgi:hypothetical protein